MSNSLSTLSLSPQDAQSLLSHPDTFLASLSAADNQRVRNVLIPAYKRGFRIVFLVGATLSGLAFLMAVGMMPQVNLDREDDEALKLQAKREEEEKKQTQLQDKSV